MIGSLALCLGMSVSSAHAQPGGMGGGMRGMMSGERTSRAMTSHNVVVTTTGGQSVPGKLTLSWVVVNCDLGRYEVNPDYVKALEDAGLVFSGISPDEKLMEIAELPKSKHPFFLGTQFHPEFLSRPLTPHPLFIAFIKAALAHDLPVEK